MKTFLNLHIHSHKTNKDSFDYVNNIDILLEKINAIQNSSLIAFTNHDSFYAEHFNDLKNKNMNKLVNILPGAELTFKDLGTHCLIIVSENKIEFFNNFMNKWQQLENKSKTWETFIDKWPENEYGILVFHYEKDPSIKLNYLSNIFKNKLDNYNLEIAVECSSMKDVHKIKDDFVKEGIDKIPIFSFFDDNFTKK